MRAAGNSPAAGQSQRDRPHLDGRRSGIDLAKPFASRPRQRRMPAEPKGNESTASQSDRRIPCRIEHQPDHNSRMVEIRMTRRTRSSRRRPRMRSQRIAQNLDRNSARRRCGRLAGRPTGEQRRAVEASEAAYNVQKERRKLDYRHRIVNIIVQRPAIGRHEGQDRRINRSAGNQVAADGSLLDSLPAVRRTAHQKLKTDLAPCSASRPQLRSARRTASGDDQDALGRAIRRCQAAE